MEVRNFEFHSFQTEPALSHLPGLCLLIHGSKTWEETRGLAEEGQTNSLHTERFCNVCKLKHQITSQDIVHLCMNYSFFQIHILHIKLAKAVHASIIYQAKLREVLGVF